MNNVRVKKEVNRKIKGEYVKISDTVKYNLKKAICLASGKECEPKTAWICNVIGQGTKFIDMNEYNNILLNGYNVNKIVNDIITISFDSKIQSKRLIDIIGYVISKYNGLIVKNGKDKKAVYSFKIALKPSALKKVVRSLYKVYGIKNFTIRNNSIGNIGTVYINSENTLQEKLSEYVKK